MTRFLLLLWAVLLSTAPLSALAQSAPQWSDAQLKSFYEEAQIVKRGCEANINMYSAYDCECLAAHTYDNRVNGDVTSSASAMLEKTLPKCGNAARLAGQKYDQCVGAMSAQRRDYETYCQCFGVEFAKYYGLLPSSRSSVRIKMMTEAHRVCTERYPLPSADNQRQLQRELRQRGLFERLFPGLSN